MINVDNLSKPDALIMPTYDELLAQNVAVFQSLHPDWEPHASDENMMLLEAFAYRELHLHRDFNNRVNSLLLLYSKGSALDAKGGDRNLERLEGESDEAFLERILMSWDGYSTAGALGAYEYHARSVSSLIENVQAFSPKKGVIHVAIATYAKDEDGRLISLESLVPKVIETLSDKKKRPVCDEFKVFVAKANETTIDADVIVYNEDYLASIFNLIKSNFAVNLKTGKTLVYSKIIKYLEVEGVHKATPTNHNYDIECADGEIIRITSVNIHFFNTDGDVLTYE